MICRMCPRNCGAVREAASGVGYCGMPALPVVARAALHHWEEPPISGWRGSGTVFFSGCSMGCVFCQNEEISHKNFGVPVSLSRLRAICEELAAQGAHNINLVNPTHFAHVAGQLLDTSLGVPVVWNSGGYDRVETLRTLEGKISIYLPDFKYLDPNTAQRYSAAPNYPQIAQAAILEMVRQTGPCVIKDGVLQRGTVIRHLILPGRTAETKQIMDWVAGAFPPGTVLFSLMSQYLPWGRAADYPEINRPLRPSERRICIEYMQNLGLDGFVQAQGADQSSFIPAFDLTGV